MLGKGHSWWKTKNRGRCKWVSNSFKLCSRIAGHCYWNPIIGLLSLLLAASVDCNHLAFYNFTFTFPSKYPILRVQKLTVKKRMVGDFCGWRTIHRNEKIPVLQMLLGFPGCTFYWTSSRLNLLSFATKNCTTTSFRDSFKLGMEGTVSPWTQDGWCWWPDQVTFLQTKPDQVSFSQTKPDKVSFPQTKFFF